MSEIDRSGPPMICQDCGDVVNEDHNKQGFGHYMRCCDCYERRQRGLPPKVLVDA